MGRIQRAFERRYNELLAELRARDRTKGLAWFQSRAEAALDSGAPSLSHAHTELLISLLNKVRRFRVRADGSGGNPKLPERCRVICDAGLGGLARWLRAAGCEAFWTQDISDPDLVAEAQRLHATIITTDSLLLDRRVITHGHVRAIWIPPTLTIQEQLRLARAELGLPEFDSTSDSRCMRCGGELVEIPKEQVRERIPPRTYRWLDEYFQCTLCGQLYWHGTHWQRIRQQLAPND